MAHGPAVALHRARTGPVDPAPPVEDRLARSAVTQDCLGRRCRAMTPPCVVPTFRPYTVEHLEFGGFYASSCESRAKVDKADQHYFDTVIRPMLNGPGVEMIGEI